MARSTRSASAHRPRRARCRGSSVEARGRAAGSPKPIAGLEAGPGGRRFLHHGADEQPVALREADRGTHPARDARVRERDAELGRSSPSPRASASTRAQRGVGGEGEDQPALAAYGVEPEQAPVRVDRRAA